MSKLTEFLHNAGTPPSGGLLSQLGGALSLPGNIINAYVEGYRQLPQQYRDAAEVRRLQMEEYRRALSYIDSIPDPQEQAIARANLQEWAAQRARQYAPQITPRGGMISQGAVNGPQFQTAQPTVPPPAPPFGLQQEEPGGTVTFAPGYLETQRQLAEARRPTAEEIRSGAAARQSARPPPRASGAGVGRRGHSGRGGSSGSGVAPWQRDWGG